MSIERGMGSGGGGARGIVDEGWVANKAYVRGDGLQSIKPAGRADASLSPGG